MGLASGLAVGASHKVAASGWSSRVGAVGAGRASLSTSCTLGASPFGLSMWAGWASSQHGGSQLPRPASQENHAEAALHFVTRLKS